MNTVIPEQHLAGNVIRLTHGPDIRELAQVVYKGGDLVDRIGCIECKNQPLIIGIDDGIGDVFRVSADPAAFVRGSDKKFKPILCAHHTDNPLYQLF